MAVLSFQCRHRYPGGFQLDAAFELGHRFTALFGPSGSGKTSVLSMIAGVLTPQAGIVRLGDRTLLDTAQSRCLRPEHRKIGVVFQDARLFPHMTVEGNLQYGQRRRNPRRVGFSRVVEVLEIGPLLHRSPRHLSGGERQRVALGRAMLSSPELLIMDEPLASLDDPLKERILGYLDLAIAEWGIPTLLVTHSQAEVRRVAEWVVVMEKGRVIGEGTPEQTVTRSLDREEFRLGHPRLPPNSMGSLSEVMPLAAGRANLFLGVRRAGRRRI